MNELGWLFKLPIVSLFLAAVVAAVPFLLAGDFVRDTATFEKAREEARSQVVRNPKLEVDSLGELILDPVWLAEARAANAAAAGGEAGVQLPARMLVRTQARLDDLIARAFEARMSSDPAWRFGVLDAQSPRRNYVAHVFVHEAMAGIVLCVLVLLTVAAPLERTWGSSIFALFACAAIPVTAYGYRLLDAVSGVPWSGSAGLAGALLGAYFIRGLGGHFMIPGWVMLPAWIAAESFIVRGFWLDDLGGVPWATLSASIGFGAFVAGALRLMNVESKIEAFSAKRAGGSSLNPVVSRAARLRSDGDPLRAFDLIQAAWREDPKDEDIAEAFFGIAEEVGQPEAAAEAVLPLLRTALRKGEVERAVAYWLPLASQDCDVRLEATAAVRLGEALLDRGHPEEALCSLHRALDEGVSPAHAARIVNIARDLDEGITRRAAAIALSDQSLDPRVREDLGAIAHVLSDAPPGVATQRTGAADPAPSHSQLERRLDAEHQTVETTIFPGDVGLDLDRTHQGDLSGVDPNEATLVDQALDPGALSVGSLADEIVTSGDSEHLANADTGDVLSHWNDPTALDGSPLSSLESGSAAGSTALGLDDLEPPGGDFDLGGLAEGVDDFFPSADEEVDTDLTPLIIDATDELTSPLGKGASEVDRSSLNEDTSTAVFDQPTVVVSPSVAAPLSPRENPAPLPEALVLSATQASPSATDAVPASDSRQYAIGVGAGPAHRLRSMKALEAVPLQATPEWIEIDAAERGKSKLPIMRIQAIAMAAVSGLASRPVLLVDFVLNWNDDREQSMKLIRLRSDRFDPLQFEPGAGNPLAALTTWVVELQSASDATCLPSRDLLSGSFARFESLEDYEREVLMAVRDGEP